MAPFRERLGGWGNLGWAVFLAALWLPFAASEMSNPTGQTFRTLLNYTGRYFVNPVQIAAFFTTARLAWPIMAMIVGFNRVQNEDRTNQKK